jgi:Domain of unknown function (DUF3472)/Domain of unknown function (DUF5077)
MRLCAAALLCLGALLSCAQMGAQMGAQTSLEPRAARSVHLRYQGPDATAFYNEVTVEESVPGSYFMACGFHQGYFGIQELRPGQDRVVLFSVWDPGAQNNPSSVPADRRVETLYHADDVTVRRFGGEGTGGQSFFRYLWKAGQTYRFLVEATVEKDKTNKDKTAFAAYFFLNETGMWKHLVTFRTLTFGAVTGGAPLSGFYSFIEDFRRDGESLHQARRARFGDGWVRGMDGNWVQLTEARFTADATAVDNFDGGVREGDFYLATGGATEKHTELQTMLKRPLSVREPPRR